MSVWNSQQVWFLKHLEVRYLTCPSEVLQAGSLCYFEVVFASGGHPRHIAPSQIGRGRDTLPRDPALHVQKACKYIVRRCSKTSRTLSARHHRRPRSGCSWEKTS